ncbi:MAG: hydroxyphenylacetyl-CoA thioesterase PaaI [Paracoccaceae bacterium]
MTPQEVAEASAKSLWDGDSASQRLGMVLERVVPGGATLTMTVTEAMSNGHGSCHGGYIFTFADSAFAFACNSYNQRVVGQHCSITYLIPVRLGDKLTAVARETSRQGRSGVYDIRITNQDGAHVAEFRGHSRIVKGTHLPVGD